VHSSGSIVLLTWETQRSVEIQVTVFAVAGFVENISGLLSTNRLVGLNWGHN
jgi:hypothetical protein